MSDQSSQSEKPKPWNDVLQLGWKETVESWGWQPLNGGKKGYYIGGKCPYCHDDMGRTLEIVETIFEAVKPPPKHVWVQCNCKVVHPPHNAGEGCGQGAEIPGPRVRP